MDALDVNTKYLILGAFVTLLDLWAGGRLVGGGHLDVLCIGSWIPNQNMNGYSEHHMPLHTVHIKLLLGSSPPKPTSGFPAWTFKLLKILPLLFD